MTSARDGAAPAACEWQRAIATGDIPTLNRLYNVNRMPKLKSMRPAILAAKCGRADSLKWVLMRGYNAGPEVCRAAGGAADTAAACWLRDDCSLRDVPCRQASGRTRCPLHGYDGWGRAHVGVVWAELRTAIYAGRDPAGLDVSLSILPQVTAGLNAEALFLAAAVAGNIAAQDWLHSQLPDVVC